MYEKGRKCKKITGHAKKTTGNTKKSLGTLQARQGFVDHIQGFCGVKPHSMQARCRHAATNLVLLQCGDSSCVVRVGQKCVPLQWRPMVRPINPGASL